MGKEWPPPSLDPPHHLGGVGGDGERGGRGGSDGEGGVFREVFIIIGHGGGGRVIGSRCPHEGASPSLP